MAGHSSPQPSMVCPHCGTDTPSPATVCRSCRTPFPQTSAGGGESETITYGPGHAPGRAGTRAFALSVLEPGAPFGTRYRILRELGAGGMGIVYQAWDAELGVAVALKVIRPDVTDDPSAAQEVEKRFKRELLLARQVTHKNVVRIHDLGEVDGIKYITMPYIEGKDLADVLQERGRLPVPEALRLTRQIAAGLVAAHEAGVVHRDLKPENIMIDGDGQPLIMDFGISRSVMSGTATATAAGAIVGTLEYMAPEQARGVNVDQRADLYALGLILYDMLAGRRRVAASESALTEMMRRMQAPLPSLRTVAPDVPDALERIVARCLKTNPDERYQTTAALLEDLDSLGADGRALPLYRQRHWNPVTATLAVLVLVSAGAAVWFWQHRAAPVAPVARAPVSVLIADFDNETGDAVFQGSLEQALGIVIEGAPFITSFPRQEAQRAIQRQKPNGTLNEEGARLVAASQGIGILLLGQIASAGADGYDLTLRAVDARTNKTVATKTARATSKPAVLEAVGTLATGIRTTLGDAPPASATAAYGETFTAGSLEAMKEYSLAQELALNRRDEEAIPHYRKATELDPNFGRAYAGWAVSAFTIGRKAEADEQWKRAVALIDRMTEREKYRTLGSYALGVSRNYTQAIENYSELVRRYPADNTGHSNLALAYFFMLDFPHAFDEGRKAMALQPGSYRFASNYALYAMYAGEFDAAARQASELIRSDPDRDVAYLPLAISQIAAGKLEDARATYRKMSAIRSGASTAAMGLADLAMYQGRYEEALAILQPAVEADVKDSNTQGVATKYLAIGEADAALGRRADAQAAIAHVVDAATTEDVLLPASRVLAAIGREAEARELASRLGSQIPVRTRAYGKIIEGELALRAGKARDAFDDFDAARRLSDVWLTHFDLGVALVQADQDVQAISEFDLAQKRRGEATALFLDDIPTFRMLAPLPYWQGRASEGAHAAAAARDYFNAYLALRGSAQGDPLAIDARKRLGGGS